MRLYDTETGQFFTNGASVPDVADALESLWLSTYLVIGCFSMIGPGLLGPDYWANTWALAQRFCETTGIGPELAKYSK